MKKFTPYSLSVFLSLSFILFVLISCNGQKNQQETADFEAEQSDLNLPAIYTGTLPCADCPGINYQLIIKDDGFTELSQYQDRSPATFEETGTWKITDDTLTLIGLEDLILKRFLVNDTSLTLLNMNNQRITGELADMYILERTEDQDSIRIHHQELAEQGFTFFAAGNEPFWSLRIDSLNQLIFETPDSSIHFGEVNQSIIENEMSLDASTDSTQLSVQVQDEYCQDSMSGYLFPLTITATMQPSGTDSLKGCGLFLEP